MNQQQHVGKPDEFESLLSQFETCLETPVVAGELQSWADAVEQACADLDRTLRREFAEKHPDQFAQIGQVNPELLRQVELLREQDASLQGRFDEYKSKVGRFCQRAEKAEPHESKLDEQVSAVVDDGLALVIAIRKQQQAISTWLVEAYQRDTGVAD